MSFDTDVNPIRQDILYWICNNEFNKARDNMLRGAIAYRTMLEQKHQRRQTRQLHQAVNALRKQLL